MLPTSFTSDGALSTAPYERLVGKAAETGCRGVVCLGVMGEAPRLSDAERTSILEAVTGQAGDALTVTAGITSPSHHLAALRASEAEAIGATAVMVAPPHTMMRRGLLDTAVIRSPGPSIDADTEKELDELLASLELERV